MASTKGSGVMGASTSALRKMFANPLKRSGNAEQASCPMANARLADDSINGIIEGEIIPRLLMAHAIGDVDNNKLRASTIDPSDANRFATLPLRLEAASLLEEVDNFLEQGISVETIFVDLLAPTARRLGEMWEEDECDFVDVTMGLWRLQEVMRDISLRSPAQRNLGKEKQLRVLFAPVPGDQHNFGSLMLDEVFGRAGWDSEAMPRPDRKEMLDSLSAKPYDLVGLTVSRDCPSAALSNLIRAIRSVSANPHVSVIIGGRRVNECPSIVSEVGADGTGADARAALAVAERLVQSAPARAHELR